MKNDELEAQVLELWKTTTIPLTYANVEYHTRASRRKVHRGLDELVREGVLDAEAGDQGELVFSVVGASRATNGPRTVAELERLQALRDQSDRRDGPGIFDQALELHALKSARGRKGVAKALARGARRDLAQGKDQGRKSLVVSGGLSLLFGPAGWLYAGSFREALPAAAVYLLLLSLIPTFLLLPLLGVALPLSGIAGVVYAWQHNQDGKRTPILGRDED